LLAPNPLPLDLGAAVGPEARKLSPAQVKERIAEKERTFVLAERLQKALCLTSTKEGIIFLPMRRV
jgi:hypothetical protein